METFVIGIAGGSGSGKSTFARALYETFPEDIALINCDNYYLPHDDIPLEERELLNYDSPESLEFSLMCAQISALRKGKAVECPTYDFSLHTHGSQTITIEPKPIIIIDGILILSDPNLRKQMDLKIFVETDADERILRRAKRDVLERGRSIESVMDQYLRTVKPMHNLYVEPSKIFADIIVNGGINKQAIEVIKYWMHRKIKESLKESAGEGFLSSW